MSNLWICTSCHSIGNPSRWSGSTRRRTYAPACAACGRRTTLPIDTPKGVELASSLGVSSEQLREMEWRSYLYWPRVFWLIVGGWGFGAIVHRFGSDIGIMGSFFLFAAGWGAVSLALHFRARPPTGT